MSDSPKPTSTPRGPAPPSARPPVPATHLAGLVARCPACNSPLAPAMCTAGAVIHCESCQAPVSLALKSGAKGLTFVIWAGAGMQLSLHLREAKDGPCITSAKRPQLEAR